MTAGDWIALYAATVATAAVAWQAVIHVAERRPKLRVRIALLHFLTNDGQLWSSPNSVDWIYEGEWRLEAQILNFGRGSVRVSGVSFQTLSAPDGWQEWTSSEWGLPWVLEAGDERTVCLTDDDAGALTPGQEFIANVNTPHDKRFRSEPVTVGENGRGLSLVVIPAALVDRLGVDIKREFRTVEFRNFGPGGDRQPE